MRTKKAKQTDLVLPEVAQPIDELAVRRRHGDRCEVAEAMGCHPIAAGCVECQYRAIADLTPALKQALTDIMFSREAHLAKRTAAALLAKGLIVEAFDEVPFVGRATMRVKRYEPAHFGLHFALTMPIEWSLAHSRTVEIEVPA